MSGTIVRGNGTSEAAGNKAIEARYYAGHAIGIAVARGQINSIKLEENEPKEFWAGMRRGYFSVTGKLRNFPNDGRSVIVAREGQS